MCRTAHKSLFLYTESLAGVKTTSDDIFQIQIPFPTCISLHVICFFFRATSFDELTLNHDNVLHTR
jgi:hypothetical protein